LIVPTFLPFLSQCTSSASKTIALLRFFNLILTAVPLAAVIVYILLAFLSFDLGRVSAVYFDVDTLG
jgi:hypothetical protein